MTVTRPGRVLASLAAIAVLSLAAACGSSDTASPASTSAATESPSGPAGYGFGAPADPADATSTVDVRITGTAMAYDPATVQTSAGATVKFVFVNDSDTQHEFVLGDEETQAAHDEEMKAHAMHGPMADEPNGFLVAPHTTKTLAWKFTEPGDVVYGCHVVGHYAAGMRGTVQVSA